MLDMWNTNCLVDIISYSEKLCFSGGYVNGLVTCFDDWPIKWMNMWDWGSDLIFYAHIKNNNASQRIWRFVKLIINIVGSGIEKKTIWKIITDDFPEKISCLTEWKMVEICYTYHLYQLEDFLNKELASV